MKKWEYHWKYSNYKTNQIVILDVKSTIIGQKFTIKVEQQNWASRKISELEYDPIDINLSERNKTYEEIIMPEKPVKHHQTHKILY